MKETKYVGYVAEDRVESSDRIQVYVNELLPHYDGELKDIAVKETIEVSNPLTGKKETVVIKTSNTVTARYRPTNPYVYSIPYVMKGERVYVYTTEDNDDYEWTYIGHDTDLHEPEICIIGVSGTEIQSKPSVDNMYSIVLDSRHNKSITLRTSDKNDEEYKYLLTMGEDGRITLADNDNREITLNSKKDSISLRTKGSGKEKTGAMVVLDGDNIKEYVPGDYITYVGGKREVYVENEDKLEVSELSYYDHSKTAKINLSDSGITDTVGSCSRKQSSGDIVDSIGGTTNTLDAGSFTSSSGALSLSSPSAGMKLGGDVNLSGNVKGDGSLDVSGSINCASLNASGSVNGSNI